MSEVFGQSWLASDSRNVLPVKVESFLFISKQWNCNLVLSLHVRSKLSI